MNRWCSLSIDYANQRSYLDDLFQVYPTIPEGIRNIDKTIWAGVEKAFEKKDNDTLARELLKLDLFPVKDSYIAYLKRDRSAIARNPRTINRICGRLYEMGLDKIFERCSEPKETNRQIGPMFRECLRKGSLGIVPVDLDRFESNNDDAVLDASDKGMMDFARKNLGYQRDKGLDFVARFNGQYVIGEAKFLTDFGGHQNAQFNDAISTLEAKGVKALKIAVLDGVLYIPGNNKMYKALIGSLQNRYIMSALVLREFLYHLSRQQKEQPMRNLLIKGDNIDGLCYLLHDRGLKGKIDLVYIDPPFATGGNFTVTDNRTATISSVRNAELAYSDKITGKNFLDFLRKRLVLLKDLLSNQGSIYLHIDYKIGHYVKVLMDDIFGTENFRNDITRIKCNPKNFDRVGYGNIKDLILFYTKSSNPIWNEPRERYTEKDLEKLFPKTDKQGRRYTTVPIHAPGETGNGKSNQPFKGMMPPQGRHWRTDVETLERWDNEGLIEWSSTGNPRKKIFADEREGKRVQDIWEYKDPQYPVYPTEKNPELLNLIIRTSSNINSIVLDCFCGSGTTLKSAQINGRKWIGMDESDCALKAAMQKLNAIEEDFFIAEHGYDFLDLEEILKKEQKAPPRVSA